MDGFNSQIRKTTRKQSQFAGTGYAEQKNTGWDSSWARPSGAEELLVPIYGKSSYDGEALLETLDLEVHRRYLERVDLNESKREIEEQTYAKKHKEKGMIRDISYRKNIENIEKKTAKSSEHRSSKSRKSKMKTSAQKMADVNKKITELKSKVEYGTAWGAHKDEYAAIFEEIRKADRYFAESFAESKLEEEIIKLGAEVNYYGNMVKLYAGQKLEIEYAIFTAMDSATKSKLEKKKMEIERKRNEMSIAQLTIDEKREKMKSELRKKNLEKRRQKK